MLGLDVNYDLGIHCTVEVFNVSNFILRKTDAVKVQPLCAPFALHHGLCFCTSTGTEGFLIWIAKKHSNAALLNNKQFVQGIERFAAPYTNAV